MKLYTREEFEALRADSARKMAEDKKLQKDALDVLVQADHYHWIHQTNWLGEPILQLPQDMFALQDIWFKTRPEFIVEVGVAWGGSLLFYATLMEAMGAGQVIGVDVFIPPDLKARVGSFGKISERIKWVEGSSIETSTFEKVRAITGSTRKVMVNLDSNHTHEHVLAELRMYSPLVGKGHYLICGDTIVERIPEQKHRPRPWGIGNNPMTALDEFLGENDRFKIDPAVENKLLFTCNPRGFLHCVKD